MIRTPAYRERAIKAIQFARVQSQSKSKVVTRKLIKRQRRREYRSKLHGQASSTMTQQFGQPQQGGATRGKPGGA